MDCSTVTTPTRRHTRRRTRASVDGLVEAKAVVVSMVGFGSCSLVRKDDEWIRTGEDEEGWGVGMGGNGKASARRGRRSRGNDASPSRHKTNKSKTSNHYQSHPQRKEMQRKHGARPIKEDSGRSYSIFAEALLGPYLNNEAAHSHPFPPLVSTVQDLSAGMLWLGELTGKKCKYSPFLANPIILIFIFACCPLSPPPPNVCLVCCCNTCVKGGNTVQLSDFDSVLMRKNTRK